MNAKVVDELDKIPGTWVESVLKTEPDQVAWDGEFDVLVVGFGAAGVSAAIQAKELNQRVAFIDRFEGGGTSARSGSVVYAGGGTSLQQRLGVKDDPSNMFEYLRNEVADAVSDNTLKRFCEQSPANFSWLTQHGVKFSGTLFDAKTSYPVHGHSLYYSGNELVYSEQARPAPRGHVADGIKRFTAFGPAMVGPLIRSALKMGVQPIRQTRVHRLIQDPSGRIIGVEARQMKPGSFAALKHRVLSRLASYAQIYFPPAAKKMRKQIEALEKHQSETTYYRANKGVVLATGGFILNKAMTDEYLQPFSRAMRLGTPGDMGEGIALGVSAGGVADKMGNASAWRFINPPAEWPKAMLVDRQGARYVNEAMYGASIGTRMMEEHRGEAILIMDKTLFEESVANLNLKSARLVTLIQAKTAVKTAKSADTIEALAERLKIDAKQLGETLEQYNRAARGEITDPFSKQRSDMREIKNGPFYAIDMSAGKGDITSVISLGGLRVCEDTGAVVNAEYEPISGLYAAGRTALGIPSNAYISGLSLADGVFSGRRAGKSAAAAQPARDQSDSDLRKAV